MSEKKIWKIKNPVPLPAILDSRQGPISPLVASLLYDRGLTTATEQESFLFHKTLEYLADPWQLPDMQPAIQRIVVAIKQKQRICIYGDYDVDGMTSTALLQAILQELDAMVNYHIPDRQTEGYGLNKATLDGLLATGTELVITVDCGISAVSEAAYAKDLGLDLIITDHHNPPELLPQALAVINPKLSTTLRSDHDLAGVGVAFKVAQCLCEAMGQSSLAQNFLDYVAIGTVADIVPLLGDNRILVTEGLKQLNHQLKPGLFALMTVAGLTDKELNTGSIAFALAPRLNASGRMTNGSNGVTLLLENDPLKALMLAEELNQANKLRQETEGQIMQAALEAIETQVDLEVDRMIILGSDQWHPGVIGIVASRLTEKFHRPTFLVCFKDGVGKGSGRSITGFNLYNALNATAQYLLGFGGHEMACGFSISADQFTEFKAAILSYTNGRLTKHDMLPVKTADMVLAAPLLNLNLVKDIKQMAPFGSGNSQPTFVLRNVLVGKVRQLGVEHKHLKLSISSEGLEFTGLAFNMGERLDELDSVRYFDILFVPEINTWQQHETLQLNIKDFKNHALVDDPQSQLTFLEALFLEGSLWQEEDSYRDILNKESFFSKIVGVSFDNRREALTLLKAGDQVLLRPEPDNAYDQHAIAVCYRNRQLGYLKAGLARHLSLAINSGLSYGAYVAQITGYDQENLGVNLCIYREGVEATATPIELLPKAADDCLDPDSFELTKDWRKMLPVEQQEAIRIAVLGNNNYRTKQQETLDALMAGQNTLLVMGTGRGKSAVFQIMAAHFAAQDGITILIYPLRSLVNDQYQRFLSKLGALGVGISTATGVMSPWERKDFFKSLYNKQVQVVLTTPEFLDIHYDKFMQMQEQIRFMVIDEAHHIGQYQRPGYQNLAKLWLKLGKPLILATTATTDTTTVQLLKQGFSLNRIITEDYCRSNLNLVDARQTKDKLSYLLGLLNQQSRCIIYVNSRRQTFELAGQLRSYLPHLQSQIAFYHGGLDRCKRQTIESQFRQGEINILVSTSAFGEGIDIPDIRDVILYHLCFAKSEYNQLSGRAGRDGQPANIHLLYNINDQALNQLILQINSPDRQLLGKFYLFLRDISKKQNPLTLTNRELSLEIAQRGLPNISEQAIPTCLGILEELGLLLREQDIGRRYIHLAPPPPTKLNLNQSVRYLEGQNEALAYQQYLELALTKDTTLLLSGINRPILPE